MLFLSKYIIVSGETKTASLEATKPNKVNTNTISFPEAAILLYSDGDH